MHIKSLIDDRNFNLWNALNKIFKIEIQAEERPNYSVYSKNGKSIIYVPSENINSASFTHELLHIYLKSKNIYIGSSIKLSIKSSEILSEIFSDNLLEHISNCLDHIKMLPEFIKLGYNENEFISDFSVDKLTTNEISYLNANFSKRKLFKKIYNITAIDMFIGKFFAAFSCPNKSFNYKLKLGKLKNIDEQLYKALEKFANAWAYFDYEEKDLILGDYTFLLSEFISDIENWTIDKKIEG